MLELSNYGHMTPSTIWFEPLEKKFVYDVMDSTFNVITLSLRQPGVVNFADTIEITVMLIQTTFNESIKSKELEKIN